MRLKRGWDAAMPVRHLFTTCVYEARVADTLAAELAVSCRTLATDDRAGRAWSKAEGYPGYTSYASLNDLPRRDPVFADLRRALDVHVAAFAAASHMDLKGRRLKLDSLWVNVMRGGVHTGHIHPYSAVSGTVYVAVPPGAGRLKFEDPRLGLMMAAPPPAPDAPAWARRFAYAEPVAGDVLLWDSWLRHEVTAGTTKAERISVSFNYA